MPRRQSRKLRKPELIFHSAVYSLLQHARSLAKARRNAEAKEAYRRVLEIEPQNPKALFAMGDIHLHEEAFQEAVDYFESCLSVSPATEYACYALGNAYRALHRDRHAQRSYESVLEINPSNTRALTRLADLLLKKGNFKEVVDCCTRALELEPGNTFALNDLAQAYRGQKNYEAALRVFQIIVGQHPRDYRALTRMGDICLKLGQHREAERRYREALRDNPRYSYALEGLERLGLD